MKYIEKSFHYNFLKPWLRDGLLLSSGIDWFNWISLGNFVNVFVYYKIGKKWHNRRKIITPAFHFKILERFVEIFDRLGNTVIDKLYHLDDQSRDEGLEFRNIAALYALDVMCGKKKLKKNEQNYCSKMDFSSNWDYF